VSTEKKRVPHISAYDLVAIFEHRQEIRERRNLPASKCDPFTPPGQRVSAYDPVAIAEHRREIRERSRKPIKKRSSYTPPVQGVLSPDAKD